MTPQELDTIELRCEGIDVPPLVAEVRRLRRRVAEAELRGGYGRDAEPCCPWCEEEAVIRANDWIINHSADCVAFDGSGSVR